MSTRSGPPLAPLLRRLLDTPGDYLLEPRVEGKKGVSGELHVDALVSDTLRWMGGPPLSTVQGAALRRGESAAEKNALRLASITAWLLCDSAFKGRREGVPAARRLLLEELRGLAGVIRPGDCVTDPDRREELARLTLAKLELHPEGETEIMARDRLKSLDSAERLALAKAAAAAEKRAKEIREAAAKAAAEAASAYGRE